MSEFTGAYEAALQGASQEDPAAVVEAWDRLVDRYGYDVAAEAWHAACVELSADAV